MSTFTSAKLYARVAFLRRQLLAQLLIRRAIAGALAVSAFIVSAGLATIALFLAIRAPLGDVPAILLVAGVYFVLAAALLVYALREPVSPELTALSEMETAALETAAADTQGLAQMVGAAGERINDIGGTLALGVSILSALRKLLGARKAP